MPSNWQYLRVDGRFLCPFCSDTITASPRGDEVTAGCDKFGCGTFTFPDMGVTDDTRTAEKGHATMWSRTAPRHTGSVVRRLSTIGGVLLAVTAATAGPASAAASNDITVALSPTKSTIMAVASPRTSATDRDATVGYGGSVTVQF